MQIGTVHPLVLLKARCAATPFAVCRIPYQHTPEFSATTCQPLFAVLPVLYEYQLLPRVPATPVFLPMPLK